MSQQNLDSEMFDEGDKQLKFSDLFILNDILGAGSFGTVVSAMHKQKMRDFAIKIIRKKQFAKSGLRDLYQEAQILSQLNHKNIVQFHKYIDTETKAFIVMELVSGGSLKTLLDKRIDNQEPLSEDEAATLMKSLLTAVDYCHNKDIVHRDLKPENVLLQNPSDLSSVKVCDFGLSAQYDAQYTKLNFTERCGTKIFMAPEQIEKKAYSKPVDLWSSGIIMYMLLNNGKHPVYRGKEDFDEYKENLIQMDVNKVEGLEDPLARDLFTKLCCYEPEHRYTAEQAMSHPWITRNKDDPIPMTSHEQMKAFHNVSILENFTKIAYLCYKSLYNKQNILSPEYLENVKKLSDEREQLKKVKEEPKDDIYSVFKAFIIDKRTPPKPPMKPENIKQEQSSQQQKEPFFRIKTPEKPDKLLVVQEEDKVMAQIKSMTDLQSSGVGAVPKYKDASIQHIHQDESDSQYPANTDPVVEERAENQENVQEESPRPKAVVLQTQSPTEKIDSQRKKILVKIKRVNNQIVHTKKKSKKLDRSSRSSSNESQRSDSTSPASQLELRKKFMYNLKPVECSNIIKSVDTHPKQTILKQYKKTNTNTKDPENEDTAATDNVSSAGLNHIDNDSVSTFGSEASPSKIPDASKSQKKKGRRTSTQSNTVSSIQFLNKLGRKRNISDPNQVMKPAKPLTSNSAIPKIGPKSPVRAMKESLEKSGGSDANQIHLMKPPKHPITYQEIGRRKSSSINSPGLESNSNSSYQEASISPLKRNGSQSSIQKNEQPFGPIYHSPALQTSPSKPRFTYDYVSQKSDVQSQEYSYSPKKRSNNNSLLEANNSNQEIMNFNQTMNISLTHDQGHNHYSTQTHDSGTLKVTKKKVVLSKDRYSTPQQHVYKTYDDTKNNRDSVFTKLPEIRDNKARSKSNVKIRTNSFRPTNTANQKSIHQQFQQNVNGPIERIKY